MNVISNSKNDYSILTQYLKGKGLPYRRISS